MSKRFVLSAEQLSAAVTNLAGWHAADGKLTKQYKFNSFAEAMGWMMSAAIVAEKMDHHPEWCNVYSRVDVTLTTHDQGNQISSWDVELAQAFDALYGARM